MMEEKLKERLVGASVLVILAIIVIPMVLDGPGNGSKVEKTLDLPEASDTERRTVSIPLNQSSQVSRTTPPEVETQLPKPAVDAPPVSADVAASRPEETRQPPQQAIVEEKPAETPVKDPTDSTTTTATTREPAPGNTAEAQPWTVQVGSFSSETNAAGLVRRLRDLGYDDAHVSRFNDGSRIHYRVRVGGYDSREAAAAAAEAIRAKSGEPARPAQNTGDAS